MNCPQCGAPLEPNVSKCKYCGEAIQQAPAPQYQQPQQYQQPMYQQPPMQYQQPMYQQPMYQQPNDGINPAWPIKSKIAAGILALLVGGIGIHKFYLGKIGMGVVYLLFCWTGIPAIVGFIEGIIYLCSNDHNFQVKNQVRLQ
ncbi:MAG: NINE protein [Ruminiclostridium sp.]